jgi:hypothetical protein
MNTYTIILILFFILLISDLGKIYLIKRKQIKREKITKYTYLKIKEKLENYKFLEEKKPEYYEENLGVLATSLSTNLLEFGIFKMEYLDNCISDEEIIKNKLLNLHFKKDIQNVIEINYYNRIIDISVRLIYTKKDSLFSYTIYSKTFTSSINKKEDVVRALKWLETIEIIRNIILEARKNNNLDQLEKNNILVNNINKRIDF